MTHTCPCGGPVTFSPANPVDDGERVRWVERAVMACEECGAVVEVPGVDEYDVAMEQLLLSSKE